MGRDQEREDMHKGAEKWTHTHIHMNVHMRTHTKEHVYDLFWEISIWEGRRWIKALGHCI